MTDRDVAKGDAIARALTAAGIEARAYWTYLPDVPTMRLVLAMPLVDREGVREAYRRVDEVLQSLSQADIVPLGEISLVGLGEEAALRKMMSSSHESDGPTGLYDICWTVLCGTGYLGDRNLVCDTGRLRVEFVQNRDIASVATWRVVEVESRQTIAKYVDGNSAQDVSLPSEYSRTSHGRFRWVAGPVRRLDDGSLTEPDRFAGFVMSGLEPATAHGGQAWGFVAGVRAQAPVA